MMIKEITAAELKRWKDEKKDFQLIDIREDEEVANGSIGGIHWPMDTVISKMSAIAKDIPVVVHCNSGKRSSAVVYTLTHKYGFENVYSLCGGIQAYAQEINPQILQAL